MLNGLRHLMCLLGTWRERQLLLAEGAVRGRCLRKWGWFFVVRGWASRRVSGVLVAISFGAGELEHKGVKG